MVTKTVNMANRSVTSVEVVTVVVKLPEICPLGGLITVKLEIHLA